MFWEIISRLGTPVFTWNVFPYHPHERGNPLTNRCHTPAERRECQPVLQALIELLRPARIIAVGNDAEFGLQDLGIACSKVRHPSYGGKADFVAGMLALHPGSSSGAQPQEVQTQLF
jgi:uracil-DNA glycosylase